MSSIKCPNKGCQILFFPPAFAIADTDQAVVELAHARCHRSNNGEPFQNMASPVKIWQALSKARLHLADGKPFQALSPSQLPTCHL